MKSLGLFVLLFLSWLLFQDLSCLFLTGRKVGFLPFGEQLDLFYFNGYWLDYLNSYRLNISEPNTFRASVIYLNESFGLFMIFLSQLIIILVGYRLVVVFGDQKISKYGLSVSKFDKSLKMGLLVSLWSGVILFILLILSKYLLGLRIDDYLSSSDQFEASLLSRPIYFISVLSAGCIGAALFEEFLFRGVLLAGLNKWMPTYISVAIGALVFSLFHFNLDQIPFYFLCGIVTGFLRYKTDHLLAGCVFHFSANFFILCILPILH